jgi:tetratricopeptide (TPR) repeat protein
MSQAEVAKGMKHPEALEFYDRGLALYRQGRVQEAVALWRRVIDIEPDNFIVRKQVWAVEHPEKFYDGAVDFAWQREQMAKGQ